MRRTALTLVLVAGLAGGPAAAEPPGTLRGFAKLPADSFGPGPSCGHALGTTPFHGRTPPFASQPIQGVSALAPSDTPGTYLALSDNGFGTLETSADYLLRIYTVRPRFKTQAGGEGTLEVRGALTLSDPHGHVPFPIVHAFCCAARPLTGADFDVESLQRAPDGTLWLGDEFGPFLLHADANGALLEPPIPLVDADGARLRSPQSPDLEEASAVRVMNALWSHARRCGGSRPVFSPAHVLLADGDPTTGAEHRQAPPPGSGLRPASSELFDVKSLQRAGYRVVPYTVNDAPRIKALLALGVDGIISDDPELLYRVVAEHDADGDGQGGDLLTADGSIDAARFDAQGHRGGRNLRPENTLPAMELALDALMTTLECDTVLTADGVPVLSHETYLPAQQFRRADGAPYTAADELLIRGLTLEQVQRTFVGDGLRRPRQTNDLAASPLAVAFAEAEGLPHPYAIPSLAQLFRFVRYYAEHEADPARAANARRVRFNVETKINPRSDRDDHGRVRRERGSGPEACAQALLRVAEAEGMLARLDVQSFDLRSLLAVQRGSATPGTILLVGDYPVPMDDGTNLQPEGGRTTPWLGGLRWPYRATLQDHPARVRSSGGFEGMALSPDGATLYPMLEQPLTGSSARELLVFSFDVATRRFTGVAARYPLDPRGKAIGSFQLIGPRRGLVLERDDSQGDLAGFKRLFEVELGAPGELLTKRPLLDLLDLRDPDGLAAGEEGDVGLGERFALPFVTIESVLYLSPTRVLIANDNNYPFSVGRHLGSDAPDDTELVELELPRALGE
ncbi:MAG: esterase-like activity of phytase family protein [Planctomycetes bacterium]|nr:esterase-like activity of phytase family protein [Planctomycetota bacterium]